MSGEENKKLKDEIDTLLGYCNNIESIYLSLSGEETRQGYLKFLKEMLEDSVYTKITIEAYQRLKDMRVFEIYDKYKYYEFSPEDWEVIFNNLDLLTSNDGKYSYTKLKAITIASTLFTEKEELDHFKEVFKSICKSENKMYSLVKYLTYPDLSYAYYIDDLVLIPDLIMNQSKNDVLNDVESLHTLADNLRKYPNNWDKLSPIYFYAPGKRDIFSWVREITSIDLTNYSDDYIKESLTIYNLLETLNNAIKRNSMPEQYNELKIAVSRVLLNSTPTCDLQSTMNDHDLMNICEALTTNEVEESKTRSRKM